MEPQQSVFEKVRASVDKRIAAGKPKSIFGPLPPEQWPVWVKALRQFSTDEDEGIGDVVYRIIGDENSLAFKAWHLKTFGKECNCTARRNRWNKLYPLK